MVTPIKCPLNSAVYEGCLVPDINRATHVSSSHSKGAKLGEEITVTCEAGERKYTCGSGNTWEPRDIAAACPGEREG